MKPKLPPCPRCRSAKQVVAQGVAGDLFVCRRCGGLFDNDPHEGSDVFADPSRRMEMQEASRRGGERRRR